MLNNIYIFTSVSTNKLSRSYRIKGNLSIVTDILQLLRRYGRAFIHSTPHLYCSALTWVPSTTQLAITVRQYFPNKISIFLGQEGTWPSTNALWVVKTMGTIHSLAFSPDGKHIVSGSDDKTLRIWDAGTGQQVGNALEGHTNWVRAVAYSPDGKHIVSGSHDKTLRIWNCSYWPGILCCTGRSYTISLCCLLIHLMGSTLFLGHKTKH